MPKAQKRTRERQADFTKAKLKLGKGKKQPTNATDTSFKARSIALPGQTPLNRALAAEENGGITGEPRTSQGLVLDEVLIRFRHPNAGVRKDSLGGLKEIVVAEPGRQVGKVVRGLGGLISDEESGVRKALLGYIGWYLPLLSESTLSPHLPLLILQTSSALSHIFPEIRLDACRLVDLLLHHVPQHITGSWPYSTASNQASSSKHTLDGLSGGSTILEGLRLAVGLGGDTGSAGAQLGRLGAGGKLVTLRAMLAFVQAALNKEEQEGVDGLDQIFAGYLDEVPSRSRKGKEKAVSREPTVADISAEGYVCPFADWTQKGRNSEWEIGRLGSGVDMSSDDAVAEVLSQLYLQLHPLLFSTFLEAAPSAFSINPAAMTPNALSSEDIPLALCSITACLAETFAQSIFDRAAHDTTPFVQVRASISDFLAKMALYFPFRAPKTAPPMPTGIPPGLALSLAYASLAVRLAPRPRPLFFPKGRRAGTSTWRGRIQAVEQSWLAMRQYHRKTSGKSGGSGDSRALHDVAEWVSDTLAPPKDILTPRLTPTGYAALLPIIWALLTRAPRDHRSKQVIQESDPTTEVALAFLQHLLRQGSSSTIRKLGDKFAIRLIQTHEQRHPNFPFFVPLDSPTRSLVSAWLQCLAKTLWELGNKDEDATSRLLGFLLDLFQQVSSKLAPFFYLSHPSKGGIPGPWTRLQKPGVKSLGRAVGTVWLEWDAEGKLQEAARRCF